jgi:hypothetical protein
MVRRDGVRAESPGPLPRPYRRVDPALVEEPARHLGEVGRERAVGVEDELMRFAPRELGVLGRHRRETVVVGDPVETEEPGLERVPALRDVVAPLDRLDQSPDRLVACLVVEVTAREPVGITA